MRPRFITTDYDGTNICAYKKATRLLRFILKTAICFQIQKILSGQYHLFHHFINNWFVMDIHAIIYNSYIIPDIIDLFTQFYSTDSFSIDEIKTPKDADDTRMRYFSLIFNDGLLRFYFELWPNGTNKKSKGKFKLYLCICPTIFKHNTNINQIAGMFTIGLKETDTIYSRKYAFSKDHWYFLWETNTVKLKDIQHLNSLTFTLAMHIYSLPNRFTPKSVINYAALPTFQHVCNIDDKSIISEIHSTPCVYGFARQIFEFCGLKWFLIFYPNGSRLQRLDHSTAFLSLASASKCNIELFVKLTLMFRDRILKVYSIMNEINVSDNIKYFKLVMID